MKRVALTIVLAVLAVAGAVAAVAVAVPPDQYKPPTVVTAQAGTTAGVSGQGLAGTRTKSSVIGAANGALPFTGQPLALIGIFGLLLLAVGLFLLRRARHRDT